MTIKFEEEEIMRKEKFNREPYVGYFSPKGELIDYNILLGGNHHDDWRNPVSATFLSFVSYIIEDTSSKKLGGKGYDNLADLDKYPNIDEVVKRGYSHFYDFNEDSIDDFLLRLYSKIEYIKRYSSAGGYKEFEYRLMQFFINSYKNRTFFETIGKKIKIENPSAAKEKMRKIRPNIHWDDLEYTYRLHLKMELLSYFKEICVSYLGYDSLEQFKSNGDAITIPIGLEYNFDFLDNPRVITSSSKNINERYFNYLLMDWEVRRVPRFIYNERTEMYEEESSSSIMYQSKEEECLEKEIGSIKRLIPRKYRYKYFRN